MSRELIKVANLDDFASTNLKVVAYEEREILLCRLGDGVYAVDNLCSHAAERLCTGKLKGGKLFCPLHGAAFDVKTGIALSRPATDPIDTFEVVFDAQEIFIRLPGGDVVRESSP